MTQTELNLDTGLVPCLPSKGKYGYELEIKASNCLPIDGKVESIPTKGYGSDYNGGNAARTGRVAFVISLDEKKHFNPLADIASRRTYFVDGDERYETMRKCLVNAARLAVANGVAKMPEGYTMDDLNKLKGFRWSPKAGCSMCPCSPAFMSPLLVDRRNLSLNWLEFVFAVKQDETVKTMLDVGVMEQLVADPTLAPLA